ncbi:MAG: hypothetical protein RMJ15_00660 [Nitrososphaerota archaeon]|nr:hypothetical protein [Nitrososphaerota archaeon]
MMRTVEIFIAILIIMGAFVISSFYAVLPIPRRVSPMNLRRLALTTLQILDSSYNLSDIAFKSPDDPEWVRLQIALSVLLPPNIVYNLTVYDVQTAEEGTIYVPYKSLSNAESLGIQSEATSYLTVSSNVTFKVIPEKIGESGYGGTLYILNCSDARGWWVTGYTAQSLAEDLYRLLSPYFQKTIMVQNTTQLEKILNGTALESEKVNGAVIINTFGEAVPIPSNYADMYYRDSYAEYFYQLGRRVNQYNWTWVSIVGWPFYYVTNTVKFANSQNGWGIYGMVMVAEKGLTAFLRGLDYPKYPNYTTPTNSQTGNLGVVYLNSTIIYYCNYYGIYPSPYQTSTRALPDSILRTYNLDPSVYIFDKKGSWIPGAVFRHVAAEDNKTTGSFFALGLTRTPDIRLTAIGLLSYYKPRLHRSEFNATRTSKLTVLQLGIVGGV